MSFRLFDFYKNIIVEPINSKLFLPQSHKDTKIEETNSLF
jgi:hypothetical protein